MQIQLIDADQWKLEAQQRVLKNAGQPASFAVALCWALLYVRCHMKMAAGVKRQNATPAKDAG